MSEAVRGAVSMRCVPPPSAPVASYIRVLTTSRGPIRSSQTTHVDTGRVRPRDEAHDLLSAIGADRVSCTTEDLARARGATAKRAEPAAAAGRRARALSPDRVGAEAGVLPATEEQSTRPPAGPTSSASQLRPPAGRARARQSGAPRSPLAAPTSMAPTPTPRPSVGRDAPNRHERHPDDGQDPDARRVGARSAPHHRERRPARPHQAGDASRDRPRPRLGRTGAGIAHRALRRLRAAVPAARSDLE